MLTPDQVGDDRRCSSTTSSSRSRSSTARPSASSSPHRRADRDVHPAGRSRRHGQRQRHQARHARDRARGEGAPLHQGGGKGEGPYRDARVRRTGLRGEIEDEKTWLACPWPAGRGRRAARARLAGGRQAAAHPRRILRLRRDHRRRAVTRRAVGPRRHRAAELGARTVSRRPLALPRRRARRRRARPADTVRPRLRPAVVPRRPLGGVPLGPRTPGRRPRRCRRRHGRRGDAAVPDCHGRRRGLPRHDGRRGRPRARLVARLEDALLRHTHAADRRRARCPRQGMEGRHPVPARRARRRDQQPRPGRGHGPPRRGRHVVHRARAGGHGRHARRAPARAYALARAGPGRVARRPRDRVRHDVGVAAAGGARRVRGVRRRSGHGRRHARPAPGDAQRGLRAGPALGRRRPPPLLPGGPGVGRGHVPGHAGAALLGGQHDGRGRPLGGRLPRRAARLRRRRRRRRDRRGPPRHRGAALRARGPGRVRPPARGPRRHLRGS